MYVKELWRYPVKSMRGEQVDAAELTLDGIPGDRLIHVRGPRGVLTARTRYGLLGLAATTTPEGEVLVDGTPWQDPKVAEAIREVAGPAAEAVRYGGPERFDVLNLLVATDGALAELGHNHRRLRPNIVLGDVAGLAERDWPGMALTIGDAVIGFRKLRSRCIVTTIDPDTIEQDLDVLRDIQRKYEGTFALDSWVLTPGTIRVGDRAEVVDAELPTPVGGGWIVGAPYIIT